MDSCAIFDIAKSTFSNITISHAVLHGILHRVLRISCTWPSGNLNQNFERDKGRERGRKEKLHYGRFGIKISPLFQRRRKRFLLIARSLSGTATVTRAPPRVSFPCTFRISPRFPNRARQRRAFLPRVLFAFRRPEGSPVWRTSRGSNDAVFSQTAKPQRRAYGWDVINTRISSPAGRPKASPWEYRRDWRLAYVQPRSYLSAARTYTWIIALGESPQSLSGTFPVW